jgi:hypothetical protein
VLVTITGLHLLPTVQAAAAVRVHDTRSSRYAAPAAAAGGRVLAKGRRPQGASGRARHTILYITVYNTADVPQRHPRASYVLATSGRAGDVLLASHGAELVAALTLRMPGPELAGPWAWATCALLVCCSLPLWLPALVVRLRNRLFVTMNSGDGGAGAGVELPGSRGRAVMRFLYEHKAANLRLRQPTLGISDLFAYFLSPAHEIHQV